MSEPIVVKLGGSYAGTAECEHWLAALDRCRGHAIVVPGGGPFADAVREAQRRMGFHDRAAHHMALLAMEQYGCALAETRAGWHMANSLDGIRRVLAEGGLPVWAPTTMVLAEKDLPACWELSSDSLAAWLAGKLGVRRLLIVKPVVPSPDRVSAAALAAAGVVDPLFPRFLGASGTEAYIAGPIDHAAAAAAIRSAAPPGLRIALP